MSAVERFVCDYCGRELSENDGWFFISEECAIAHTGDHNSEHCIREDFELDFCCKEHLMSYIDEHLCDTLGLVESYIKKNMVISGGIVNRSSDYC
ncbi:MAG: hypothetical protein WC877_01395 [Dehalococcoidales bacterium]|jgi:hypothetical protein